MCVLLLCAKKQELLWHGLVLKFSILAKSKTHLGDVYMRFALVCRGGQQAFPVAHLSGCFALATAMAWHFQHSSSKVPEVTPPGWLEGTRWQGMPYHVTLGLPEDWSLLPAGVSDTHLLQLAITSTLRPLNPASATSPSQRS